MSTRILALLLICAIAVVAAVTLREQDAPPPAEPADAPLEADSSAPKRTDRGWSRSPSAEGEGRTVAPDTQPAIEADPPDELPAAGPLHLRARVVDRSGAPLGNTMLRLTAPRLSATRRPAAPPREARTDAEGTFDAGAVEDEARAPWSLTLLLDEGYGTPDASSQRPIAFAPTPPDGALPTVQAGHGPRVVVRTTLPPGLEAEELLVELQCTPSVFSSQIGGLGGSSRLRQGESGELWAWIPSITNGVRDPGAALRVLSLDGLWGSDWEPIERSDETGAPRRVLDSDEIEVTLALEARGVVEVTVQLPEDAHLDALGGLYVSPGPGRRDGPPTILFGGLTERGTYLFRWLAPVEYEIRPLRASELVFDPATSVLFVAGGQRTEHSVRAIPAPEDEEEGGH